MLKKADINLFNLSHFHQTKICILLDVEIHLYIHYSQGLIFCRFLYFYLCFVILFMIKITYDIDGTINSFNFVSL